MKRLVSVNEKGLRVGQDHPQAKLSDLEVEALIRDRGPEDAPLLSYGKLARKYGISKSGVRDILTGRRRGGEFVLVEKPVRDKKVRVNLRLSLSARATLIRLGGGQWLERQMVRVISVARAHHVNPGELKVSIEAPSRGSSPRVASQKPRTLASF
ncbi:MAG: hypothetical protein LBI59_00570 [Candidatus Accumulibacter sp.]|jgi:hypothetical protein|nr:hypothetical protein [Accumulibacter sp.]